MIGSKMWPRPEDLLSIRLHVSLLKVGGEAVHVLVVREQGVRLGAEKVAVPLQSNHDHVFQNVADIEFKIRKIVKVQILAPLQVSWTAESDHFKSYCKHVHYFYSNLARDHMYENMKQTYLKIA